METQGMMGAQGAMGQMGAMDQTEPEGDEAKGSGGYCIEIHVGADGKLSVEVESEAEEAQEEGAEAGGEAGETGSPASSIKEALTMALAIYKNNGQMPDDTGADEAFQQGVSGKGY
jgi:hypothetical protein